jgi:hypothetical protein
VLAVGIRQPPAVISALAVPYVDRQYCVHLCWRSTYATRQHWYLSWRAIKPTASTDTSPCGLLSQPPAYLSEYLRSERDSTQLLTHSHTHTHTLPTLATAASSRNRPCTPPPPLVSFVRAPPPQPPSANCRPTLQPPVPPPTSSKFTTVAWRAAPSRPTLANSCLSPCWSACRVSSG